MQLYEQLEKEWGEFVGNPNIVACNSGTAALHLALEAMELKGAGILVPDFTMVACARAVTMAGMHPIFTDCKKEDLLLDCSRLQHPWDEGDVICGIMPVHIYGRQCDMEAVHEYANTYSSLAVIEDMAEIHGVKPHPDTDAACWSFYKNKIVAGEEGGAIAFRNPDHAVRAKQLRSLGMTDSHDFYHIPRGHNYRMSNLHAEPILRSLKSYKENAQERRQIEKWYDYYTPTDWQMPKRDAVWVYDIRLPLPGINKYVVQNLNDKGIQARMPFAPMQQQQEYKFSWKIEKTDSLTCAFEASREIMYLPVYPGMSEGRVRDNVNALREAVNMHDIIHLPTARSIPVIAPDRSSEGISR